MDKKSGNKLAQQIVRLVKESPLVEIPGGKELIVKITLDFRDVEPPVHVLLLGERSVELVKTDQPFGDEHFREIFKLPLSSKDRSFVEFYRNNGNKGFTAYQLVDKGFAERGRFISVNRMCRTHGLWLGIKPENTGQWDQVRHRFFVLKERGGSRKHNYARG